MRKSSGLRQLWERALPAILVLMLTACSTPAPETDSSTSLSRTLSSANNLSFESIESPLQLVFPRDHAAHPRQRIEWWYLTARLQTAEGRRFGTQVALFRYGLQPEDVAVRSDWSGKQIYLAHAAVTDIDGDRFLYDEHWARGAAGLAGVQQNPWRVWANDCSIASASDQAFLPLELACGGAGFRYRLSLSGADSPVLHGDAGYSRKSDAPGSASAYYSYPRLTAVGQIQIAENTFAVSGQAWYDHEWTSGVLAADQVGWDWFSLRLSDGSALMLFNIRDRQDQVVARHGSLIAADGGVQALLAEDIDIEPSGYWRSDKTGVSWPVRWRLHSPSLGLTLEITPLREDQELDTTTRYWEGAIDAQGLRAGQPISGEGYLELTGYSPR
ncbi:MAG: lipocalin-like domain-containing protein [Lysobacterales bacterium]|nr:carotenoid 1,2-hydratase [Rhodanobacteraceae bacterium]